MTVLLLDVWHDLRAKRLWPVALAIAVALTLSPLILLYGAGGGDSSAQPPAGSAGQARSPAKVTLVDQKAAEESELTVFGSKNPFRPAAAASGGRSPAAGSSSPAGAGSARATEPGDPPSPSVGTTGGGGGGGDPSSPAPSSQTSPSSSPAGGRTPDGSGAGDSRRVYTFRVDLRFGELGRERTMRNVDWLSPLPADRTPAVIFLGTTESTKSAGFLLVDANGRQDGEGECAPKATECSVIYLRLDPDRDTHTITMGDGTIFRLRLLAIKRVRWSAKSNEDAGDGRGLGAQGGPGTPRVRDLRSPRRTPFIQEER